MPNLPMFVQTHTVQRIWCTDRVTFTEQHTDSTLEDERARFCFVLFSINGTSLIKIQNKNFILVKNFLNIPLLLLLPTLINQVSSPTPYLLWSHSLSLNSKNSYFILLIWLSGLCCPLLFLESGPFILAFHGVRLLRKVFKLIIALYHTSLTLLEGKILTCSSLA